MDDQLQATDNGVVETTTTQEPITQTTPEAKPATLDDAVKKAFESHAETNDAAAQQAAAKPVDPITGREVEPIKPPASLTPTLREKWQSLDPQYQRWMSDRERDMSKRLNETADDRKFAAEVRRISEPYSEMLRGFGQTASQHIDGMFKISNLLATGSSQQKAQFIDQLIRQHLAQTPDGMQWLTHFASGGQVAQQAQPQQNIDELVNQRLAEREAADEEAAIATELEKFAAENEFYNDVRFQMGKIIEAGLVDGKDNTELFKNAYDLACQQHPEIKSILAQRTTTTPKARAVNSVKPSLGSGRSAAAPAKNMSIDDAVAAAFAKHGLTQ